MSNTPHSSLATNDFPPALRPFYEGPDRVQVIGERLRMDCLRVQRHLLTPDLLDRLRSLESDGHPFRTAFDALDRYCLEQIRGTGLMAAAVEAYRDAVRAVSIQEAMEAVQAMMSNDGSTNQADDATPATQAAARRERPQG